MSAVNITSPQSLNLYSYTRNNPIDFVDPTGLLCYIINLGEGRGYVEDCSPGDDKRPTRPPTGPEPKCPSGSCGGGVEPPKFTSISKKIGEKDECDIQFEKAYKAADKNYRNCITMAKENLYEGVGELWDQYKGSLKVTRSEWVSRVGFVIGLGKGDPYTLLAAVAAMMIYGQAEREYYLVKSVIGAVALGVIYEYEKNECLKARQQQNANMHVRWKECKKKLGKDPRWEKVPYPKS